ncbi:MAG: hypothetical protein L0K86_11865 [Actinomycetia bacterium]|nr:hypothetical protein [Actinomycetes bacterium]
MALVPTRNPGLTGAQASPIAANAGGDTVAPGTRLNVLNGGAGSINVIVATPGTVRGLAIADRTIACPNGTGIAGLTSFDLPGDIYADPADGLVHLTYSATPTSVTLFADGQVTT